MSQFVAKVKWNQKTYDVKVNTGSSDNVVAFKQSLEDLTGVPTNRMKVLAKTKGLWKGILKDYGPFCLRVIAAI